MEGFRAADVEKAATAVARTTIDSWLTEPVWTDCPPLPAHDTAAEPAAPNPAPYGTNRPGRPACRTRATAPPQPRGTTAG